MRGDGDGWVVSHTGTPYWGRHGAAGLLLLGWPALFISLGYNFIDYAINPPEGMGSTAGWWVCGILFALMGLPALAGIPMLVKAIQPERRNAVLAVFLIALEHATAFRLTHPWLVYLLPVAGVVIGFAYDKEVPIYGPVYILIKYAGRSH